MNDTTNNIPATGPAEEAPLVANTDGSNFELKSYDIAPEDAALAAEIEGRDILSTQGPVKLVGAVRLPATIGVNGLPPHLADPIKAELARTAPDLRAQREQALVLEALKANSRDIRVAAGPGEGSDPHMRERLILSAEIYELERRIGDLTDQLAENDGWDKVNGQPVPRYVVTGQRRSALEAEQVRLLGNLKLLDGGVEGKRRLQRSLYEAVQLEKERRGQLAEHEEAKAMADAMLREERVKAKAELLAKSKRTTR